MFLVSVFVRLLIKTAEFDMWLSELAIDSHKLSIRFPSNSSNSVDISVLAKDALVGVSTVPVDLVSDWDIPSLSIGLVSETGLLALSIVCLSMGAFNRAGERFIRASEHARLTASVIVVVMAVWWAQRTPEATLLMISSSLWASLKLDITQYTDRRLSCCVSIIGCETVVL